MTKEWSDWGERHGRKRRKVAVEYRGSDRDTMTKHKYRDRARNRVIEQSSGFTLVSIRVIRG